jgi:hypothetical protein
MIKAQLSKTTYLKSLQCQKHLYLYKNYYSLQDPLTEEKKALFSRGINVGLFARNLFPNGKDATPKKISDQLTWVKNTKTLIEENQQVIYEAAFIHNNVFVAVDMLVKKDQYWYAYEVKSSAKISPVYLTDAALQYHVITQQNIAIKDISIVYVNNDYIRDKQLQVNKLFHITSVLESALSMQTDIAHNIEKANETLNQNSIPDIAVGSHCFEPYTCDFKGYCWKNMPKDSIFEVAGLSKKEQFEFFEAGIQTQTQLNDALAGKKLPELYLKSKSSNDAVIDIEKIRIYLKDISYPIYFTDFEAFMPAIPLYEGTSPFEFIPFQFSIHAKTEKNAPLQHFEFLAEAGQDPRKNFIVNFLKYTEKPGCILAYDISGEKKILLALAKNFPEFEPPLKERISRLKDLNIPFKEFMVYHHQMKNANSLKAVLHTLFPDLSYEDLKIKNGNMASIKFESLQKESDIFNILQTRDELLEYCKTDTLAMTKIFEWLEAIT